MFNLKMNKTMAIVKRNGGYAPTLSNFFDDFFTKDLWDNNWLSFSNTGTTIPKVNIQESNNDFRVQMAAPGMKKDDFKVELDNNLLTISSTMTNERNEGTEGNYTRREFSYQSFQRSFHLPETVEVDKIEAKYHDGILNLVIPKKEEAKKKPVRTIKIS
jgi:HSP20 family protein